MISGSAARSIWSARPYCPAMLLNTPPQGYAACCEAIRDADLTAQASRVKTPTLVISGSHDPATPVPAEATRYACHHASASVCGGVSVCLEA